MCASRSPPLVPQLSKLPPAVSRIPACCYSGWQQEDHMYWRWLEAVRGVVGELLCVVSCLGHSVSSSNVFVLGAVSEKAGPAVLGGSRPAASGGTSLTTYAGCFYPAPFLWKARDVRSCCHLFCVNYSQSPHPHLGSPEMRYALEGDSAVWKFWLTAQRPGCLSHNSKHTGECFCTKNRFYSTEIRRYAFTLGICYLLVLHQV